jgi:hypothetical protein
MELLVTRLLVTLSLFLLVRVDITFGFEHTFSNASVEPVTPFGALVSLASRDFSKSLALTRRQEEECSIPGGRTYLAVAAIFPMDVTHIPSDMRCGDLLCTRNPLCTFQKFAIGSDIIRS